jgi:arginine decarboxylase
VAAKLPADEQQSVLDELQAGLDGYTYLEEL